MATQWKIDGTSNVISPPPDGVFTFKELQGFVGGSIEMIFLDKNSVMIVNEEGMGKLPLNANATRVYQDILAKRNPPGDAAIFGDAVVCSNREAWVLDTLARRPDRRAAILGRTAVQAGHRCGMPEG